MVVGENIMLVPTETTCAADEPKVLCIIRDMTDSDIQTKCTLNLPGSMTVRDLIEEVSRKYGYEPGSFILTYEKREHNVEVEANHYLASSLADMCQSCGTKMRNNFNIMEKDGKQPTKVESSSIPESVAGWSSSTGATYGACGGAPSSTLTSESETGSADKIESGLSVNYTASSSSSYGSTQPFSYASAVYGSGLIKSETGYVGLVNQAMTCYLNSLLQTLYMTPEFRNAVYRWELDGTDEEAAKSIPYQLQRLFLQLQTSTKRAVETTDITRSFGWDSSEAWQQHDVQELCRVMFDALEKKWKNTDQADLINQLYQGQMKDYVKCLECGSESARTDAYLDIPLVIRPFGANTAYGSVEEAMAAFVEPETLNENNQYFCEKCNRKCDAHKGLKFLTFPYLLTLQMKRFDFDYATMHRIKLNDRMTYPEILNLNHMTEQPPESPGLLCRGPGPGLMIPKSPGLSAKSADRAECVNGTESADPANSEVAKATEDDPGGAASCDNGQAGDEGIDEGIDPGYSASGTSTNCSDSSSLSSSEAAANDLNLKHSELRGPYEYELFSIMIHSGSAAGGHYYAYIKSLEDGCWYSFNDQHVTTITRDDIRKTFGGAGSSRGYYSAAFASSTNAYMLMYRRIDKDRNKDFFQVDDFPQHIKNELNKLQQKDEEEKRLRELERCTCKIKLFCFHPVHQKQLESKLEIHKDKTLKEATEIAWRQFELDEVVPLDCVRLVKYDEFHDYIDRSYEGEDDTPIATVLGGIKSTYIFDLLLEVKSVEQEFQEYKPGGVTVKVFSVDLESETIGPPLTVRANLVQTVEEFKAILSQYLRVAPPDRIRCVLERHYNDLRLLTCPNKTLKSEGFYKSNKVFVEYSGTEDDEETPFLQTSFYRLLDRYENTIRIHVSLPRLQINTEQAEEQMAAMFMHGDSVNSATASKEKKGDAEEAKSGSDLDEGLGDSETDLRSQGCYNAALDSGGGDGSVRSSTLGTGLGAHTDIHSYISETIHRQNLSTSPGGEERAEIDSVSSSGGTQSSPNVSPDENSAKDIVGTVNAAAAATPGGKTFKEEDWDVTGRTIVDREVTDREEEEEEEEDEDEFHRYFTASHHINSITGERSLTVWLDKRITLKALKRELEPFMATKSDNFKIYRVQTGTDYEYTRLTDTLATFADDSRLTVKLGRALKKGEYRVKVFQLAPNDPEPSKLLLETIFARGMSVLESKQMLIRELKSQLDLDVPLDRCRLRKKSWKSPGTIFMEEQKYDVDIAIMTNWEVFLEVLTGPERVLSTSLVSVYIRRWWPSEYKVGQFEEIILEGTGVDLLKEKLSEQSAIPVECVDFAKARGTFPCETSVLELQTELDWNPHVQSLDAWPLSINDDGHVLYYRDCREDLAELSETKKTDLQQKENVRLSRYSTKVVYSPRKERALKIYTDDSPVNSS